MALGIGTNSLPPDAGMVRGKQKEVACECWFKSKIFDLNQNPNLYKIQTFMPTLLKPKLCRT